MIHYVVHESLPPCELQLQHEDGSEFNWNDVSGAFHA